MTEAARGSERSDPQTLDPPSAEGPVGLDHPRGDRQAQASMVIAAVAVTVPVTLLTAATVSDLQSQRTGDQFVFATGGFYLALAGVLAGVAATVVVASRLGRVGRGTAAFRQGRTALLLIDAALIWFGVACLRRVGSTSVPVPIWMLALSGLAVACLIAAVALLLLATLALQVRIGIEDARET